LNTYFVDTSALVKRYINETGSAWVVNWIAVEAGNVIVISELTVVEVFSVVARRVREGSLTPKTAQILRDNFLLHVEKEYLVIALDSPLLIEARSLVTQYPLRTLDSIQLASVHRAAGMLNTNMVVVSADSNLLIVATAEGFQVDNPNLHH
jgi:predicted nucleic acid-binding protein